MTKEQIDNLRGWTTPGTPWYVFAVHAFEQVPRLLEERTRLLETLIDLKYGGHDAACSEAVGGGCDCKDETTIAAITFAEEMVL